MNETFTLKSGATLLVTEAPYVDARRLRNELVKAAKGVPGLDDSIVAAGLGGLKNAELGPILDAVLTAGSSEELENAIFKCGERADYQGNRVTLALMDDPKLSTQARQDYYEIALKIIEVNCRPFLQGALSLLGTYIKTKPATPA